MYLNRYLNKVVFRNTWLAGYTLCVGGVGSDCAPSCAPELKTFPELVPPWPAVGKLDPDTLVLQGWTLS